MSLIFGYELPLEEWGKLGGHGPRRIKDHYPWRYMCEGAVFLFRDGEDAARRENMVERANEAWRAEGRAFRQVRVEGRNGVYRIPMAAKPLEPHTNEI